MASGWYASEYRIRMNEIAPCGARDNLISGLGWLLDHVGAVRRPLSAGLVMADVEAWQRTPVGSVV